MRLNHFIAKSGVASRRGADSLIKEGSVQVNGVKIFKPFFDVSEDDKVKIKGKLLKLKEHTYIILNKPKGVVTTLRDRFAQRKITDLLPRHLKGLYPVGRLDKNSTGLIILTNDGDLCYKLTHPKFSIEKEYIVELKGILKKEDCQRARKGLRLEDDYLKVDAAKILRQEEKRTFCEVVVHEGKKRHLRRLFEALGFCVVGLERIRIGKLVLGDLAPAKFKVLSKAKIYAQTIRNS